MNDNPDNERLKELLEGISTIKRLRTRKELDAALILTRELVGRFPGCAALWLAGGELMQVADNEESPLNLIGRYLENAKALAPNDPEADIELGYFLYAVKDQAAVGAEHFAQAAQKAEKLLREALIGQLKCALELGESEVALKLIEEATTFFPDDLEVKTLKEELESSM